MLFQNLKAIGEERLEICVLFCKYIYIFIYKDMEGQACVIGRDYDHQQSGTDVTCLQKQDVVNVKSKGNP
jgi:hypothetical protein